MITMKTVMYAPWQANVVDGQYTVTKKSLGFHSKLIIPIIISV